MSLFSWNNRSLNNTTAVIEQLLGELRVQVTATSIKNTLDNHPDFPSLLSISDSLQTWGVQTRSFKINKEKFLSVPTPCIVYSKIQGGVFLTIKEITQETVSFLDPFHRKRQVSESIERFQENWDGVALLVESVTADKETDYAEKRRIEQRMALINPVVLGGFLLMIALFSITLLINSEKSVLHIPIIVLKFIGCLITSLLLAYEIDKTNPFIQQICSATGKSDCSAVLDSRGSRLFNWLSWSEVGFFYFAGSFLFMLLGLSFYNSVSGVLSIINLIAVPYTIFSIYYQWRIVKQWCPLCLAVQFLLISEAILFYMAGENRFRDLGTDIDNRFWLILFFSFATPILIWMFTKRYFIASVNAGKYQSELTRLKYNHDFFEALLKSQKYVGPVPPELGLTIGNPAGSITILKVCNPYCAPCARAHVIVEQLLDSNKDLRIQIIFNASPIAEDPKRPPVKHLLSIFQQEPHKLTEALNDWYGAVTKDYDEFAKKYPRNISADFGNDEILKMHTWCEEKKVGYTPTFFIDGYQLPAIYQPSDLQFFLGGS